MADRLRAGKLGQLSLAAPPWVGALSTSLGWENNRRSGVALAMCHRQLWFIHLRAQRPMKGRRALCLRSFGVWPSFTFISNSSLARTKQFRILFIENHSLTQSINLFPCTIVGTRNLAIANRSRSTSHNIPSGRMRQQKQK